MSGEAFVDTNLLVYAHDRQGGPKTVHAQKLLAQLWTERRGVLSTQVLQEFCVNARRKFQQPKTTAEVREAVLAYRNWRLVVNTANSILWGLELEQRYKLSFWDAPDCAGGGECRMRGVVLGRFVPRTRVRRSAGGQPVLELSSKPEV
jgi:predicted nucleic acid-binding protein